MAQHMTCDKCGQEVGGYSWRLELHKRGTFLKMFEGKDLCSSCGALVIKVLSDAGFELIEMPAVAVYAG